MKLFKRFFAVALGALLLCPMTAYADQAEEARALFREVEEKQTGITDMNAFYDMKLVLSGNILKSQGIDTMDMRLEMNVKMNHITDPENMRYMAFTRVTMADGSQTESSMYYVDGYSYTEMGGQKIKMPMALGDMLKQTQASAGAFNVSEELIKDFSLWTEGENRVVGFTVDDSKMQQYLQMVMGSTGLSGMMNSGDVAVRNISGQYVVNPSGLCEKMRLKMDMDITVEEQTLSISLDGDVGFADLGQPVDVPLPNTAEYTDISTAAQAK